jgi:glycopeptide antibiotics resistance protein
MGFIPFGFCLFFYLRITREFSPGRALWCAVLIGGLTSLGIEISQVFLPTRDSSALDLINNVLGTLIGSSVMMAMHERWYRFLGRIEDRR